MNSLLTLIDLLGEDSAEELKRRITDLICTTVEDDLREYSKSSYFISPDEIDNFMVECRKAALDRVREKVISNLEKRVMENLNNL